MRATVVGAGVFGLAAATELAERGFAVTLTLSHPTNNAPYPAATAGMYTSPPDARKFSDIVSMPFSA